MKTNSIYMFAILFIAGSLTSCNSNEKKVENAQENVQDAKQDLKEVQHDATLEAQQTANADELKAFKEESEMKINSNEIDITTLKKEMKKNGKTLDEAYAKQIESLEMKNKELKARMEKYENSQSNWGTFKTEFNHDMDELGKALKGMVVDSKK